MFNDEYEVQDELQFGDTKMRLVSVVGTRRVYIQLYSSLSKQWNNMHKYNVQENWEKWKKYASVHDGKQGNGRRKARDPQRKRKRKVAR